MSAVLEVEGLAIAYGERRALHGVSLEVGAGEAVALVGANGAGKTTLMHGILGLVPLAAGQVRWRGRAIGGLPSHAIVARGLSLSPEGRQVFAELSVDDNLRLGAFCGRGGRAGARQARAQVLDLFPLLAARQRQLAGTLSGGEQQMLAIGRALMAAPELLLLDEPSLGIAPQICAQIFASLRALNRAGLAILVAEQNAALALSLAQRGYVLETGSITHQDTGAALLQDDFIRQAYLGLPRSSS